MSVLPRIASAWKAVVGFVAPAAVVIGSSVLSSSDGGTAITEAEWVTAAVAAVVTAAGVYGVKNRDAKPSKYAKGGVIYPEHVAAKIRQRDEHGRFRGGV